jgi:hypothetical protein
MSEPTQKPSIYFWIFAVFALVWNLLGVMAYLQQAYMGPEDLAAMDAAERALLESRPAWATAAFATAVFGGTLGCIALLWKKTFAFYIFIVSMVGIVVQMYWQMIVVDSIAVYGPGGLVMPIMIVVFAIALIWVSKKANDKGWSS